MLSIVLSFTLLLPSLLMLLDSRLVRRQETQPKSSLKFVELVNRKGRKLATAVFGLMIVTAVWGATKIGFAESLDALVIRGTPMVELDMRVNDILGRSQTPAVIMAKTDAEAVDIERELTGRNNKEFIDQVLAEHNTLAQGPGGETRDSDGAREVDEKGSQTLPVRRAQHVADRSKYSR